MQKSTVLYTSFPFYKQLMDHVKKASHNIVALCPHKSSLLLRIVSLSPLYMHETKLCTKEIAWSLFTTSLYHNIYTVFMWTEAFFMFFTPPISFNASFDSLHMWSELQMLIVQSCFINEWPLCAIFVWIDKKLFIFIGRIWGLCLFDKLSF